MKFTIKDKRFVQKGEMVVDYIRTCGNADINKQLLKGLLNVDKIEENKTEFEYEDFRFGLGLDYLLISNKQLGAFIVREDNTDEIDEPADTLIMRDIDKVIKNGDKTILIDIDGSKYMTTRQAEDKDDIEKAVMILLLKREGYSVKEIYDIVASVKQ